VSNKSAKSCDFLSISIQMHDTKLVWRAQLKTGGDIFFTYSRCTKFGAPFLEIQTINAYSRKYFTLPQVPNPFYLSSVENLGSNGSMKRCMVFFAHRLWSSHHFVSLPVLLRLRLGYCTTADHECITISR
jgi:hypothetical protein